MKCLLVFVVSCLSFEFVLSCDVAQINSCLLKIPKATSNEAFKPSVLITQCHQYLPIKECIDEHSRGCSISQLGKATLALGFLKYLCSPKIERELQYAKSECMHEGNDHYSSMMKQCSVMNIGRTCQKAKDVIECVQNYIRKTCDLDVANFYQRLLTHVSNMAQSLMKRQKCDLPPISEEPHRRTEGPISESVAPVKEEHRISDEIHMSGYEKDRNPCDAVLRRCLPSIHPNVTTEGMLPAFLLKTCGNVAMFEDCVGGCISELRKLPPILPFLKHVCSPDSIMRMRHVDETCTGGIGKWKFTAMLKRCRVVSSLRHCGTVEQAVDCSQKFMAAECDQQAADMFADLFKCTANNVQLIYHQPLCEFSSCFHKSPRTYTIGYIVGIVAGCAVVIGIISAVVILFLRQKRHVRIVEALVNNDSLARQ